MKPDREKVRELAIKAGIKPGPLGACFLDAMAEIDRLRDALGRCAAPFDSGPTTVIGGYMSAAHELKLRMQIAADALNK